MGYIQLKLPKRIKNKIENSRRNREAKANHEEWLQDQGLDNYTLQQKTKQFKGYDEDDFKYFRTLHSLARQQFSDIPVLDPKVDMLQFHTQYGTV